MNEDRPMKVHGVILNGFRMGKQQTAKQVKRGRAGSGLGRCLGAVLSHSLGDAHNPLKSPRLRCKDPVQHLRREVLFKELHNR
jgi:hypothetical protein